MTAFTPELYTPWVVSVDNRELQVVDTQGQIVAENIGWDHLESAQRRARLIAAAPDLFAALNAALPLLEGFEDADSGDADEDEEPIVSPVLQQMRAALAKANGE